MRALSVSRRGRETRLGAGMVGGVGGTAGTSGPLAAAAVSVY